MRMVDELQKATQKERAHHNKYHTNLHLIEGMHV